MAQFKEGDLVVVVTEESEIIHAGDIGIVKEVDSDNMPVFVDFNGYGNVVEDDGCWWCKEEELKPYTPIESFQVWQRNYQYMNEEQQEALRVLLHRVQWDEEYKEKIRFIDSGDVAESFIWSDTSEGFGFWSDAEDRVEAAQEHEVGEDEEETERTDYNSEYFLQRAIDLQRERGKEYDNGTERSMHKTVEVFNIITNNQLSESDGWLFMQILKDVRQWTKEDYHADSAEDCVSYAALKAEALANGK